MVEPAPGVQASYDLVAEDYAREFEHELDHKPFDRKMIEWLIEKVDCLGPICDLGCGPGQGARYLASRGAPTCGIDLSPRMVCCAQSRNPAIPFQQGDMLSLGNVASSAFGGIAAFYSIVHVPRGELVPAFREWRRILCSHGVLLVAFHIGDEVVRKEEWWGHTVSLDFMFFRTGEVKEALRAAGFALEEAIERDPYPEVEYPSRRAYLFARKP
jgi:SAM-dependent methyltransferase